MATGADYEVVDVSSGEEITNPGANDVMVAFHKSTGALEKIDYNKLAKAIIEQYTGSTIGGAAQSVKAAVDTIANKLPYNDGTINITTEVITRTLVKSLSSYSMIMISYYVNANTFWALQYCPFHSLRL